MHWSVFFERLPEKISDDQFVAEVEIARVPEIRSEAPDGRAFIGTAHIVRKIQGAFERTELRAFVRPWDSCGRIDGAKGLVIGKVETDEAGVLLILSRAPTVDELIRQRTHNEKKDASPSR